MGYWTDAMLGMAVGDALGLPAQFMDREDLRAEPIMEMEPDSTFGVPAGSWSDDTSMALAILDSLRIRGCVDLDDIMQRFMSWVWEGAYTPFGQSFDEGQTCIRAIMEYARRPDPHTCGRTGEHANGNGSLMRTMPLCLWEAERVLRVREEPAAGSGQEAAGQETDPAADEKRPAGPAARQEQDGGPAAEPACEAALAQAIEEIHTVSALTHNHLRAQTACGLYFFCVKAVLEAKARMAEARVQITKTGAPFFEDGEIPADGAKNASTGLLEALQRGLDEGFAWYETHDGAELSHYDRLRDLAAFAQTPETEIRSSGYVVDTLEAALWSIARNRTYEGCVLRAVNLGDDADTVGAVAGGLAGLWYGCGRGDGRGGGNVQDGKGRTTGSGSGCRKAPDGSGIPEEWLEALQKREWIEAFCEEMEKRDARRGK